MTVTETGRDGDATIAGPPDEPAEPLRRRRGARRWDWLTPYVLAAPAVTLILALLGYPLLRMVIISLQRYELGQLIGTRPIEWIGFANYARLLSDGAFWNVVRRTVTFTFTSVTISVLLGLCVALLMRRVTRPVRLAMTTAMMFVWAMPQLVSSQVFVWMVDADWGVINWLIDQIPGVDFAKHSWFADSVQGWTVINALVIWQGIPFLAITLYAGLSQVPRELIEAATVDGATAWQVFRAVTLPILRPLIGIVTTLSIIWNFQVFTQVWVVRFGKPELDYQTLATYAYSQAFQNSKYGFGAVVSIITVVLMLGVMAFYIRQMFRIGDSD
ncbi:MAG TPA: sugar ABC transporter permease [Micromonosporaceae bacterium]|nr:sugar ABC transporter permease [Micromonosporaceae bacterium]